MSIQVERDRPAPEDEIEVTEEMVKAGVDAYHAFYGDLVNDLVAAEPVQSQMVKAVYVEMMRVGIANQRR
jgi:hypothetical protein